MAFGTVFVLGLLFSGAFASPLAFDPRGTSTCVDGTANDTDINLALYYGGEGTTVSLCPGATIGLYGPIVFSAPNQEVSTAGYPKGETRATVVVLGEDQSVAIFMSCGVWCAGAAIRNIQVNGNRPTLGRLESGAGLIEAGGDSGNQLVDNCHIFEPRGWSALHIAEGYKNSCKNMMVTNNQVGPSGHSPNGGYQFVALFKNLRNFLGFPGFKMPKIKVQSGSYSPGQWADGISLSCASSTVKNNVITDATDGAIVIFGSPGSTIAYNTIQSVNRNLLGGVNLVDFAPWGGDFSGVKVHDNTLYARSAMIKIGIALGIMSWGSYNNSEYFTSGGQVYNNKFMATNTNNGYFGYEITVAGHYNANVGDNDVTQSHNGGNITDACIGEPYAPPSPRSFVYDPYTSTGTLSSAFEPHTLVFLICFGPSIPDGPGTPYGYPENADYYETSPVASATKKPTTSTTSSELSISTSLSIPSVSAPSVSAPSVSVPSVALPSVTASAVPDIPGSGNGKGSDPGAGSGDGSATGESNGDKGHADGSTGGDNGGPGDGRGGGDAGPSSNYRGAHDTGSATQQSASGTAAASSPSVSPSKSPSVSIGNVPSIPPSVTPSGIATNGVVAPTGNSKAAQGYISKTTFFATTLVPTTISRPKKTVTKTIESKVRITSTITFDAAGNTVSPSVTAPTATSTAGTGDDDDDDDDVTTTSTRTVTRSSTVTTSLSKATTTISGRKTTVSGTVTLVPVSTATQTFIGDMGVTVLVSTGVSTHLSTSTSKRVTKTLTKTDTIKATQTTLLPSSLFGRRAIVPTPMVQVENYRRENILDVNTPKVTFKFSPTQVGRRA